MIRLLYFFRNADYERLLEEIKTVNLELDKEAKTATETATKTRNQIGRLQKRLDEIIAIDFFSAPERVGAENALSGLLSRYRGFKEEPSLLKTAKQFLGKIWVTRKNVFADRIASSWLITRFIDDKAKFKYIDLKDRKFERSEADGINAMFAGIVAAHQNDKDRTEIGAKLLDDLYTYFKDKP